MNVDGAVDAADIDALCAAIEAGDADADLDGDGDADGGDMDHLIHDILGTHYGDANLDGVFDSSDLVQLFVAGKYETGTPASWAQGDFNCDGVFDSSDLVKALTDGGYRS